MVTLSGYYVSVTVEWDGPLPIGTIQLPSPIAQAQLRPATTVMRPLVPQVRLRLATPADAPGLARVFVLAWRSGYVGIVEDSVLDALDEIEIADWLGTMTSSNGPTMWLVESDDGGILAFSRHGEIREDSRRGHIYSLYVEPAATGRGIAKALLDHDLQLLGERGLGDGYALGFRAQRGGSGPLHIFRFPARRSPSGRAGVRRSRDPDAPASSAGNGKWGEMSEHEVTGQTAGQMTAVRRDSCRPAFSSTCPGSTGSAARGHSRSYATTWVR